MHRSQDELIYTLEGTYRVKLGDQLVDAAPGSFIFIPRGTAHTWQNIGDATARFFATLMPAAPEFEQFFVRFAELPLDERSVAAFARLAEAARRFRRNTPPTRARRFGRNAATSDPHPAAAIVLQKRLKSRTTRDSAYARASAMFSCLIVAQAAVSVKLLLSFRDSGRQLTDARATTDAGLPLGLRLVTHCCSTPEGVTMPSRLLLDQSSDAIG